MGKNYYLSKGNLNINYYDIKLTEIFKDMKSLEDIDMYTSGFKNRDDLKSQLIKDGLIRSTDDVCIGTYKTIKGEKRLVPIFQRKLIFKNDLEKLGFSGKNYDTLSRELYDFINNRYNDMNFMAYLIDNYYNKYVSKDDEDKNVKKIPIYESGDISILYRIIHSEEKTKRDEREYAVSFKNFINNEIFKCESFFENITFDENVRESVKLFKPKENKVNIKGLHDLLCLTINYNGNYIINKNEETLDEEEEDYSLDEFLETRDFTRPLKSYADNANLDIYDNEKLEQDDYANSFVLDEQRLVKKLDGME